MNIVQLNDDCLYVILKKLKILDLYKIAMSCKRLKYLVTSFNQGCYVNLDEILLKYETIDLEDFFEVAGHHIEKLNISARVSRIILHNDLFTILEKHCINLKYLRIHAYNLTRINNLFSFIKLFNRLEIVELNNVTFPTIALNKHSWSINIDSSLTDLHSKLKSITIKNCTNVTSTFLTNIFNGNLKHLKMVELQRFRDPGHLFQYLTVNVKQIECISLDAQSTDDSTTCLNSLTQLNGLKYLHLKNYKSNLDYLLKEFAVIDNLHEINLESCKLNEQNYDSLRKFTKLSTLKLNKNYWLTDDNLKSLQLHSKLKEFHVFDCTLISDEGIIAFVEMNTHLELLDISWCYMMTDYAIAAIINIIESRKSYLEIIANGRTRIDKSRFQDLDQIMETFKLTMNKSESPTNISLDFNNQSCNCPMAFI